MSWRRGAWAVLSLAACFAAVDAWAGDPSGAASPADARCRSQHGDGFIAVAGADACVRISGYIDAGADFSSGRGRDAPLQARPTSPVLKAGAAAALDTRFDSAAGPGQVYIEIGRPRFTP